MKSKTQRIAYRPTKAIYNAISQAHADHKKLYETESTGVWQISDTIRYLITCPYEPNTYKYSSNRMNVKGVTVSDDELKSLIENSPKYDREPNTVYILRVLVSALVQEGYLDDEATKEDALDEPPTPLTFLSASVLRQNVRQPRRSTTKISA